MPTSIRAQQQYKDAKGPDAMFVKAASAFFTALRNGTINAAKRTAKHFKDLNEAKIRRNLKGFENFCKTRTNGSNNRELWQNLRPHEREQYINMPRTDDSARRPSDAEETPNGTSVRTIS